MSSRIRITPHSSKPTTRPIRIRRPQAEEARKKLDDASARLLAVQSVFTDRRAYVNALTYEFETSNSKSAKASKQNEIDKYKSEQATVKFPDGSKKKFTFRRNWRRPITISAMSVRN